MSIVLAFSGGLDTSFCVPFLKEETGQDIITVTVDTGGLTDVERSQLAARSRELGASEHYTIDGRQRLFSDHISYLLKGNVLRGNLYPLCVGTERVVQARMVAEIATQLGATALGHGSTGAGNDQVRFDVALRLLAGDLPVHTPIRTHGLSRTDTTKYLRDRGLHVDSSTTDYSINAGLWGTTIGGKETLTTKLPLPDEAYPTVVNPASAPSEGRRISIAFEAGVPTAIDGHAMDPVELIERLNDIGSKHGVGRGIHVGDTILGIKGRVAFEAPAATILIHAHRELEKVVLSRWQSFQKAQLGDFYGMLLHEGQYFDPVMRDLEAYLDSSQESVTGEVTVNLQQGTAFVEGCESPYSMFSLDVASYGEENRLWDARDAEGFTRIYGLQAVLAARARATAATDKSATS